MNDKEAAQILLVLKEKYPLDRIEQEAISKAVGVLSWTTFAEKSIKKQGERKRRLEDTLA